MKSCFCFQGRDDSEERSQQLQFNHDCGLFIISFNFACRDFNVRLKLYAVIKFRAKLKTAQLAIYPFMSRHEIACRDILRLWEDKLSSGCDIVHFMTLLSCRDHTTLFKELLLSRHKCFCRDISPIFLSLILTKLRHQFLSRPKFLSRHLFLS